MKRTRNLIIGLMMTAILGAASAQGQVLRGVNDTQVSNLMQRLETQTDTFRVAMDRQMDNSRIDGTRSEDSIMEYINRFENATDELRDKYNSRSSTAAEATTVLNYAWYIDDFMRRNRLANNVENQWNRIRTDLNTLSRYYSVSWNWNRTVPPFGQNFPTANVAVNETQMTNLLRSLETRTNTFRSAVERQMNNRWRNSQNDDVMAYVQAFENATDALRQNFSNRTAQQSDVSSVLNYGWYVNDFMSRNRLNAATTQQWNLIRTDLNQLSRLYNVSWNWNQRLPAFTPVQGQAQYIRVDERQVRPILQRLETRTDAFSRAVDRRLDNSNLNNTQTEDNILAYVEAFENATDELRRDFDGQTVELADVTKVMNYGWYVNDFMGRNRMNQASVQQWTLIRNDLNTLSRLYNVSWNWNQRLPAFSQTQAQWGAQQNSLDGTYRLNVAASDNVSNVITQTIRNTSVRAQQQANLERRMASPQTIVIQTRGNQVRFATDNGAPVDLVADGRVITETNNRGQQIRTTVSMTGTTLNIITDGDRRNDYRVSFTPIGGNRLRVTRQLYLENQNEMITVNSVYDRTSNVAQWPNVNNQPTWNNTGQAGNFYIPNGTQLTAVLQNTIGTNVSQAGDPFTMQVTSPNQYRGAIITGRVAQAESSGRVSGRANLSMVFDTIQFRNQTYQFAGIIESAREADGENISINNEGTVRDGNQTTQTVVRAGIGALLGALIGAIADGGSGAAIGAGIGAGAGAGTVLIQGRDNLRLDAGSQFTIVASAPNNLGAIR